MSVVRHELSGVVFCNFCKVNNILASVCFNMCHIPNSVISASVRVLELYRLWQL